MGEQIDKQGILIKNLDQEVDKTNEQLVTANAKLKKILTQVIIISEELDCNGFMLLIVPSTKQILHGYCLDLHSLGVGRCPL